MVLQLCENPKFFVMKKVLFVLFLIANTAAVSAQKYFTKTGFTEFKASVETFEPVEAVNESTSAVLNAETGDVAALMFIRAFHFKVALMEEHFNENYMDSDKFPKAQFKGNLEGFDLASLTDKPTELPVTGVLTIRGIEKEVSTVALISKKGEQLHVSSGFEVRPEEFDIEIPSIVAGKIAETVIINLEYELNKKE